MIPYDELPEDQEPVHLTEAQIDHIVDRAVERVFDKIYADVGKSVIKKLTWAVGLIVTALAVWIIGTGQK